MLLFNGQFDGVELHMFDFNSTPKSHKKCNLHTILTDLRIYHAVENGEIALELNV